MRPAPNRLRVVRADKRVKQETLELKTGIPQSRISQIENEYVEPTKTERTAIARALKVKVQDVFPPVETLIS